MNPGLKRADDQQPISIRGVSTSLLCQQKFLPCSIKCSDITSFSEANDDFNPGFVFVGLITRGFRLKILHARKASEVTNGIGSILLSTEPLLEI